MKNINQVLKKPFLSNQQSNNLEFGTSKVFSSCYGTNCLKSKWMIQFSFYILFILKFSTSYIYTRVSQTENWTTLSCSILPWFIMGLEVLGKTMHLFILCCNKKLIQKSYYLIFDPSQVKILVTVIELLSPEHCQTHILSNLLTTLPHFQTLQSF